jgi:NAD(P)H dehydrogenase (quinone)
VAEVIAAVLERPDGHVGKVYELTGPRSEDMRAVAAEFSEALGRTITNVDEPLEQWRDPNSSRLGEEPQRVRGLMPA